MKTKVIRMNPQQLDMEGIREAGEILKQGVVVAFPTETVYGLGGNGLGSAGICQDLSGKRTAFG